MYGINISWQDYRKPDSEPEDKQRRTDEEYIQWLEAIRQKHREQEALA